MIIIIFFRRSNESELRRQALDDLLQQKISFVDHGYDIIGKMLHAVDDETGGSAAGFRADVECLLRRQLRRLENDEDDNDSFNPKINDGPLTTFEESDTNGIVSQVDANPSMTDINTELEILEAELQALIEAEDFDKAEEIQQRIEIIQNTVESIE
jgi:hypothetical protein